MDRNSKPDVSGMQDAKQKYKDWVTRDHKVKAPYETKTTGQYEVYIGSIGKILAQR